MGFTGDTCENSKSRHDNDHFYNRKKITATPNTVTFQTASTDTTQADNTTSENLTTTENNFTNTESYGNYSESLNTETTGKMIIDQIANFYL